MYLNRRQRTVIIVVVSTGAAVGAWAAVPWGAAAAALGAAVGSTGGYHAGVGLLQEARGRSRWRRFLRFPVIPFRGGPGPP